MGVILANYEVIRFIEHGNHCRPMMDCVSGELLIYRIKRCPEIQKHILMRWFRELLLQLEQYRKCQKNQSYRYMNPYSVLVTNDDHILLLDLEAESNSFVLRNMQKRAMRNHFVKPIVYIKENSNLSLDLYGYAMTIQFILAGTKVVPSLNRWEENRLSKIIDKCLSENPKKQYETIQQVIKKIPNTKNRSKSDRTKSNHLRILFTMLCILGIVILGTKILGTEKNSSADKNISDAKTEAVNTEKDELSEGKIKKEKQEEKSGEDGVDQLEKEVIALKQYLLKNTVKDNREVIEQGKQIECEVLRYLSTAYDRENEKEEALRSYQMLCELESQTEYVIAAYIRRISLETELYEYGEEAVLTGKEANTKFPESEAIAMEYANAICKCKTMEEIEKKEELQRIIGVFSMIEETDFYKEWRSRQEENFIEEK